jgi:septum site-determining protein MinD
MGQIIAVTAGKGGVGKSTTAAHVSVALAMSGKKTLIMELDFGLRCQDIILGMRGKVNHDIGEYLDGDVGIEDALNKVEFTDKLELICATKNPFMDLKPERIIRVCRDLREQYDYILLDTAGIGSGMFSVIKAADLILMITTPDPVCVRDGQMLSDFLYVKQCDKQNLIINRVYNDTVSSGIVTDLDEVMDTVGIPLIGVVPEDEHIRICGAKGMPLPVSSPGKKAYSAIASRIVGKDVPLTVI